MYLVAQQVYWEQKGAAFPVPLRTPTRSEQSTELLLSYVGQWVDIQQKSRKKMGFLKQFVPFPSSCLEGGRKRKKMLMELGVWCSFVTDSSS